MSDYKTTPLRLSYSESFREQAGAAGSGQSSSRESAFTLAKQRDPESFRGFTLVELLVSMGVLVLLVFLATQLINSAATVTVLGYKKMDADSEARQVFDRMAFDFQQMLKRPDVDYYLKSSGTQPQLGNDQIAFYSTVPGYYAVPTPTPVGSPIAASPVSLVSYRVNSDSTSSSYNKLERMGKSLAWNGVSSSLTPVVFLPQTIADNWCQATITGTPSATCTGTPDPNYEAVGPQVFRFEYCYLLKNGKFSDIPWDDDAGHNAVNGMQDIAAIVVDIAVIEPRSKALLDTVDPTGAKLERLNGADGSSPVLVDYNPGMTNPGQLQAQWSTDLDLNISPNGIGLPPPARAGIRVYERYFYLTH